MPAYLLSAIWLCSRQHSDLLKGRGAKQQQTSEESPGLSTLDPHQGFFTPGEQVDYDVCSNYGNWLYSAGVGNDPRENRKFNMIKQALDYDSQGDYARLWVPELQRIKGGDVHTPWALSWDALSQAGICLGETYPVPVVMAPEWSRHMNQKTAGAAARRGKGPSHTPKQHRNRGVDFYFSHKKDLA